MPQIVLLVTLIASLGQALHAQEPAASDLEARLTKLEAAYRKARREAITAIQRAQSPEERRKLAVSSLPKPAEFSPRFWKLAEADPKGKIGAMALLWIASNNANNSFGSSTEWQEKGLIALEKNHLHAEDLGPLFEVLARSTGAVAKRVVKTFSEKAAHAVVRGKASMALGRQRLTAIKELHSGGDIDNKEMILATLIAEARIAFERVTKDYAEHPTRFGGTLGAEAQQQLYRLEHLMVGKVVPDIVGKDMNGNPLKLTDYRGKVVVLEFWGHW